jgi:hypothetical protein
MKKIILLSMIFVCLIGYSQQNDTIFLKGGQSCNVYKVIGIEDNVLKYYLKLGSDEKLIEVKNIERFSHYKRPVGVIDSIFTYDSSGFNTMVVRKVPNKTQSQLYKKSIDWVATTYNTPKEVIKGQIENDYLRIEGSNQGLVCLNILFKMNYPARYMIEISFKDGKYKFDVTSIAYYVAPSQYSVGGWSGNILINKNLMYKENGEIKGMYKYIPESFVNCFNDLNNSLYNFLSSSDIPSKKSDW